MGKASEGQARSLIASFAVDTPWEEIETDPQPFIELTPKEKGERFAAFVRNGFRLIVSVLKAVIDRTKTFDAAAFVGSGWTIWKGPADGNGLEGDLEQDSRSLALTEVDMNQVRLVSTLRPRESSVKGEEKLKRLRTKGQILLDAAVFLFLWQNQHLIPESWKERVNGNIQFIYFDGTVLWDPDGGRYVLCLFWHDGEWHWRVDWLGCEFSVNRVSAVLAS